MDRQPAPFQSTIMSVIRGVAGDGSANAQEHVDRFFRDYGPPLRSYLVRSCRLQPDDADDALNQFVLEKLLCGDLSRNIAHRYLAKRRSQPGVRFRSYLVRSLKNFVVDMQRKQGRRRTVSIDVVDPLDAIEVSVTEENVFTKQWADHLVLHAIKLVREQCYAKQGQEDIWQVFDARIVAPVARNAAPEPYDQLAARLRFSSPKQASNRLQTALRKLRTVLRDLVLGYLPAESQDDEEQIHEEIAELIQAATDGRLKALETMAELNDESWLPAKRYDVTCHADDLWNDSDYAGIWTHLIALPLDNCLREFDLSLGRRYEDVTVWCGHPMANLSDLWKHPKPPIELLQAIKSYAKAPRSSTDLQDGNGLPTIVNAVLYHGAIASADLRHASRISRDSDRSFSERLDRLLTLNWLDHATRDLLRSWRSRLA